MVLLLDLGGLVSFIGGSIDETGVSTATFVLRPLGPRKWGKGLPMQVLRLDATTLALRLGNVRDFVVLP